MKKNVGDLDSRIRSRLGMILVLVGILGFVGLVEIGLIIRVVLLVAGVILSVTGSSRVCGVYSVLGVDTSKPEE
jgi:hypothetical protein